MSVSLKILMTFQNFINSDLQYDNFFLKNKYTIFKTLYVSYNRDYFEEKQKN